MKSLRIRLIINKLLKGVIIMLNAEKKEIKNEDEGFIVEDDNKATWCLRKIKHFKSKQEKNKKLAEEQISEIEKEIKEVEEWLKAENSKLENSIEFMKSKLYLYAQQLREENSELKTHKLPFGQLQFRTQRPKWKYDNDKLLDFAEKNYKELVKVKKSVDKRKLKSKAKIVGGRVIIEETGEVIEGVEVVERGEKFKVKTND
jgi:flagellar biosynthesis GTPase FlhF